MEDLLEYPYRTHQVLTGFLWLTKAPAVFQAVVNYILRELLNISVFVYLYDILVFSHFLEEHSVLVQPVLQRLLRKQALCQGKCEFHQDSVSFLGFITASFGLQMEPSK